MSSLQELSKSLLETQVQPKKHAGSRPLNTKALQAAIENYFVNGWGSKRDTFGNIIVDKETNEKVLVQVKPYTVTGLAFALGTTRDLLLVYEKNDEFSDTIRRTKEACQASAEEALFVGKNPSGAAMAP